MRLVGPLAVVVVLALSGVAQAQPIGSIAGAKTDASWSRGHAQFSATYGDCGTDGGRGCSWSAAAYVIGSDDSCRTSDPFWIPPPSHLAWLSASQSLNATVSAEADFSMLGLPGERLCLFVFDRVTKSYWVGAADFTIGPLPPPPATPVAAETPVALALTATTATTAASKALGAKYATAWRTGRSRKISCSKPRAGLSRCRVQFRAGKLRYTGVVIVTGDGTTAKTTLQIRKRRA